METVAIVAIITSISSLVVIFGKTIKNSTCLGCIKCQTRTPPPSITITPPPTPQTKHNEVFSGTNV